MGWRINSFSFFSETYAEYILNFIPLQFHTRRRPLKAYIHSARVLSVTLGNVRKRLNWKEGNELGRGRIKKNFVKIKTDFKFIVKQKETSPPWVKIQEQRQFHDKTGNISWLWSLMQTWKQTRLPYTFVAKAYTWLGLRSQEVSCLFSPHHGSLFKHSGLL